PLQQAKWVWTNAKAREAVPPQTIYLRRVWTLGERPARAVATFTGDNSFELFINGKSVGKSENWNAPAQFHVTGTLVDGKNVVAVKAANGGSSPNPAGVIGEIASLSADGKVLATLSTDDTWQSSESETAGWLKAEFGPAKWKAAVVLGDTSISPWNIS